MSLWTAVLIGLGAGVVALALTAGILLSVEVVWWP